MVSVSLRVNIHLADDIHQKDMNSISVWSNDLFSDANDRPKFTVWFSMW